MDQPAPSPGLLAITRYSRRHWAVWLKNELVAVTVYRKGARRVAELLKSLRPEIDAISEEIAPFSESHTTQPPQLKHQQKQLN